ncbi:MAG: HAD hydrolase-like protein [Phycisphaeraceae bacterium]|nr:HAD hydrolase-like protein [Phycisphaeraceae bacterium]
MKYSMVVFDMAGTTVEDAGNAVACRVREALAAIGVDVSVENVDPVMGIPKPVALRVLMEQARGAPASDQEVREVHADFRRRIVEHYRTSPEVREVAGASEVFALLRARGVRVTLDTGFDRRTLDTIVERLGWASLLDDTVASDEVEHGRPDPEMINLLMWRAGIADPARVAKIGDSVSDIEQGVAAGCGFVGAIVNRRTSGEIPRFPGVVPVHGLRELPAALGM